MDIKFSQCPACWIEAVAQTAKELQLDNIDPDQAAARLRKMFPDPMRIESTDTGLKVVRPDGHVTVTITFEPIYTVKITHDQADALAFVARQFIGAHNPTDPHHASLVSRLRSILDNLDDAHISVR